MFFRKKKCRIYAACGVSQTPSLNKIEREDKMELETTLAKNIRIADDKAKYDEACKRLLAEKTILAWIMKSCLEEYKEYDVNEIAERLLKQGALSIEQIAECVGLDLEKVIELSEDM